MKVVNDEKERKQYDEIFEEKICNEVIPIWWWKRCVLLTICMLAVPSWLVLNKLSRMWNTWNDWWTLFASCRTDPTIARQYFLSCLIRVAFTIKLQQYRPNRRAAIWICSVLHNTSYRSYTVSLEAVRIQKALKPASVFMWYVITLDSCTRTGLPPA